MSGTSIQYYEYDDAGRSSLIEGYGYRSEYQESGYQYLRFRYLDLDSGRFLSKDSYLGNEDPVSQNRYTYVGNNPINYSDPSGHKANPFKTMPGIPGAIKPIQKIAEDIAKEEEEQVANQIEQIKAKFEESEGSRTLAHQQLIELLMNASIANATPEQKREIIRAYCAQHGLDDLIATELILELENMTLEELVILSYNSNRDAETQDRYDWAAEVGPYYSTQKEEQELSIAILSLGIGIAVTVAQVPVRPTLVIAFVSFYVGMIIPKSQERYEDYYAFATNPEFVGYVKIRRVVKYLNIETGKLEILREEIIIMYGYTTT